MTLEWQCFKGMCCRIRLCDIILSQRLLWYRLRLCVAVIDLIVQFVVEEGKDADAEEWSGE